MTPKTQSAGKKAVAAAPVLYLYAITELPETTGPVIAAEGIDGGVPVEALRSGTYLLDQPRREVGVRRPPQRAHGKPGVAGYDWAASSAGGG